MTVLHKVEATLRAFRHRTNCDLEVSPLDGVKSAISRGSGQVSSHQIGLELRLLWFAVHDAGSIFLFDDLE